MLMWRPWRRGAGWFEAGTEYSQGDPQAARGRVECERRAPGDAEARAGFAQQMPSSMAMRTSSTVVRASKRPLSRLQVVDTVL